MDYKKTASEIFEKSGGKDNIVSAAHCATRLRLVIADNSKCKKEDLENIDGVKGVFFASGQLQIIIGTGEVNKVYEQFIKISGITESSKDEIKQEASAKSNLFQRAIKTLGDIFVPIIPAIVASGFLMGIMEALNFMVSNNFLNINTQSSLYVFAKLFSNTAYVFLPILIAFSAAKVFKGNPYLGAVIGMIMIHPDLQNAWSVASEGVHQTQEVFFGLYSIDMVGYQGHVIPIIIAVAVMCFIENKLHKIVPAMIDLFVTPLLSVFISAYLTLAAIGPVFVWIENNILGAIQFLLTLPLGIGSFIMGGAYATTVVSGIHHMYTVIDIGQLAQYGFTYWLPLASAANMAQGAAALAYGLKTKDKKIKSLALPASLSAFMGITEPAIFGVNLRFVRPFIAGSIGGACGALYASIVHLGATGTGVTGIFGILLHLNAPLNYIISMAISVVVSFLITWFFGVKKEIVKEEIKIESNNIKVENVKNQNDNIIYNPCIGNAIPISEVKDETFASEALGKGAAIIPSDGKVFAPFDGKVQMVFETKHAIGLTSESGIDLLIHVGINTVNLNGKYFESFVNEGDSVKMGDLLLSFDIDKIKSEGYDTTIPIIITNSDSFKEVKLINKGNLEKCQKLLEAE